MNYRNLYSKLIRLSKETTPEGAAARNKAALVKDKKIGNTDHRKTRKRNHGYDKGGIQGNKETWENLDKIIRDGDFYNYHYIPIKKIEQSKPESKSPQIIAQYVPINDPCPDCPSYDGFPELKKSTGIRWHCWQCDNFFVKGSDGKYRKIEEAPRSELEKLMNKKDTGVPPGQLGQHAGKKIIGSGGLPKHLHPGGSPAPPKKGTPGNPRVVPMNPITKEPF